LSGELLSWPVRDPGAVRRRKGPKSSDRAQGRHALVGNREECTVSMVLVVDNSSADRQVIENVLSSCDDISVCFAENSEMALEAARSCLPDVVVIDPKMGHETGKPVIEEMRVVHPEVPAVVVTSHGDEEFAIRALQSGAASYVPKGVLDQELLPTLRAVMEVTQKRKCQVRMMERMAFFSCQFILENDRDLVAPLVGYLQEHIARLGICHDPHITRLGIALDEALVNALYHGNLEVNSDLREQDNHAYHELAQQRSQQRPYQDRRIHVDAEMTMEQITFKIRDEGPGFDHQSLPDPTEPANLDKVSGRGVLLMRTFMDKVSFNKAGNEVTMVKRAVLAND